MNQNTKYKIQNTSERGFAVLISTIILSAIMLAVAVSLSFSGFFTRFNLRDSENKERSLAMAEACVQLAILKINQDLGYVGSESLDFGGETCKILPKEISGSEIIFKTKSTIKTAVSNVQVNLDSTTLLVNRWREVGSF